MIFVLIGLLIIFSSILAYIIGTRIIQDPLVIGVGIALVTVFLLVLDYLLVKSFERLAQANRLKSEITSFVTHQLRAPITNLSLVVQRLEKKPDISLKEKELFSLLEQNIERMRVLVNDLSLVSRLEKGSLKFETKEIDLENLVQDLIQKARLLAGARNIELVLEKKGKGFWVKADEHYLRESLQNLIDNAILYSKPSGGKVWVRLISGKKRVRVEIEDQGIGIPKTEQRHIFEKFFRGKKARETNTTGSGLGLYLARSFIRLMGGKISFKSQEGKGTIFKVYLKKAS